MDFNLRLKALSGLVNSHTKEAIEALKQMLQKAQASLRQDAQYDLLEQSLSILEVIGHRFSDEVSAEIISFLASVKTRQITYPQESTLFASTIRNYHNSSSLAVRAIEVLLRLRYLATKNIARTLLELSIDQDKNIQTSAIEGLKAIAAYDLDVFYGTDRQSGIAGSPQKDLLSLLLGFNDEQLIGYQKTILGIAESLLSPTIEGTRWSSDAVMISHGAVPAGEDISDIRINTIGLLKRLYSLVNGASQKLAIIGVLNDATRLNHFATGGEEVVAMITQNSQEVLGFYKSLIAAAEFPIVQKIESLSYWIYYHAPNEQIKLSAHAIEESILENSEYQIYKTLIGFESVFTDWEQSHKNNGEWEETDKFRKAKAIEFASSITNENFDLWRNRIFSYANTESEDLATFPIFYYFLDVFAKAQPKLALKLISEDSDKVSRFLIPLLRGLWNGPEQPAVKEILCEWITVGQYLYASTKQFLDCPALDRELVKRLLYRAAELNELQTVALVMAVAASNYRDDSSIVDDLFMPALEVLTNRGSSRWIFDLWFRRETRAIIAKLNNRDMDLILRNLMSLDSIDYHAEEILYMVAERMPQKVLKFLCQRLSSEGEEKRIRKTYDAIPFTLHKLYKPLATIPNAAIEIVRAQYNGDYGTFIFRGAHLLKTIFPQFSQEFEIELLNLVKRGGEEDLEFVLGILRSYEGQKFLHGVCKAVLTKVPIDSEFRSELFVILQNTGVVSGMYGFAEAYERKKDEMQDWLNDSNEKIREFASWYVERLDQMILVDRQRADEEVALRKQRFNE